MPKRANKKSKALNDKELFEAKFGDLDSDNKDADSIDVFGADSETTPEGGDDDVVDDEGNLELDDTSDDDDIIDDGEDNLEDAESGDGGEAILADFKDALDRLEDFVEDDDDLGLEDEGEIEGEIDPDASLGDDEESISLDDEDDEDLEEATLPPGKGATGKEGYVDEDEAEKTAFAASSQTSKTSLPKGKAIRSLVQAMSKMSLKDIGMMQKVSSRLSNRNTVKESIDRDVSNEVEALISLDDSLSEDYKSGAAELFEAAVNAKLDEALDVLEADYAVALSESMDRQQVVLVKKLDEFLDFAVEEFFTENKMAIEGGIRTEIAESFMNDLHGLFQERYIQVPASKVDAYADLQEQLADSEKKVAKATKVAIKYRNQSRILERKSLVESEAFDLSLRETEKLHALSESVDFTDEKSFKKSVKKIKRSFISETLTQPDDFETETLTEDTSIPKTPSKMDSYVATLGHTNRN